MSDVLTMSKQVASMLMRVARTVRASVDRRVKMANRKMRNFDLNYMSFGSEHPLGLRTSFSQTEDCFSCLNGTGCVWMPHGLPYRGRGLDLNSVVSVARWDKGRRLRHVCRRKETNWRG